MTLPAERLSPELVDLSSVDTVEDRQRCADLVRSALSDVFPGAVSLAEWAAAPDYRGSGQEVFRSKVLQYLAEVAVTTFDTGDLSHERMNKVNEHIEKLRERVFGGENQDS